MKKTKKLLALILSGILTLSISGCFNVLDGDGMVNSEPVSEPVSSEITSEEGWEKPTVSSEETGKTEKADLPYVQSGDAVYYKDRILFREYSANAVEYQSLFGHFAFNSMCYVPSKLYTFDPKNPGAEPEFVCEDSGYGDMYLVGDSTLYSQSCVEPATEEESAVNAVYKLNLSDGKSTEIFRGGTLSGFAPDGKHYAIDGYTTNPYINHCWIYDENDKEVAHYEVSETLFYLGMDNEAVYLLKETEGKNEDNTPVYQVIQFGFDGSEYCLAECDFHSVSDYYYPDYDNNIYISDTTLIFRVDFYEGTGHFYSGSIKVDVEKANGAAPSDEPIHDAKMEFTQGEIDPQEIVPASVADYKSNFSAYDSGFGFGKVMQYYTTLADGTFFTVAECNRDPLYDIGWRENYHFSNMNYYFIPTGEKEPVLLHRMFPKQGERGNLEAYEYYEMQPDMMVKLGALKDKDGEYVGFYFEPVSISGPEGPIDESMVSYIAEYSDNFYYEHPLEDIYDPFVVDSLDSLFELFNTWEPAKDAPIKDAEYDYEGNLTAGEQDYSFEEGKGVFYAHICFDEDGKIYYVRPVIFD